jgi:hypothetical protein
VDDVIEGFRSCWHHFGLAHCGLGACDHLQERVPAPDNAVERWVGSYRRDLLEHVIPFNEPHLSA